MKRNAHPGLSPGSLCISLKKINNNKHLCSGQFESTAGFLVVFCGSSNMQFAVNPFAKGLIFSKHFF